MPTTRSASPISARRWINSLGRKLSTPAYLARLRSAPPRAHRIGFGDRERRCVVGFHSLAQRAEETRQRRADAVPVGNQRCAKRVGEEFVGADAQSLREGL